ncbi:MAG TPA: hypothetical protein DCQ37_07065 [Desulfobacteraceae bacterium]|nr:hypothetical protein [Desulfobacteraceae bacterium]
MPQQIAREDFREILFGIGLTLLLFMVSAYLPVAGFFCSLCIPLAILFYRVKLGREKGAIIVAACAVVIFFLFGFGIDMIFFAELLITGFSLAEFMRQKLSVEKTVGYCCAVSVGSGWLGMSMYSSLSDKSLHDLVSAYMKESLEQTIQLYKEMKMPEDSIFMLQQAADAIVYVLTGIAPAIAVCMTLTAIWLTLISAKPILVRFGLFYPDFGRLNLWKTPDHLVWAVIGCGGMLLIPDTFVRMIALNGAIVLMTIYFFGGIAVVSFFFEKKQFPLMLRVFLYSLMTLQQIFLLLVIGLGFFDMWLNFRKGEAQNSSED